MFENFSELQRLTKKLHGDDFDRDLADAMREHTETAMKAESANERTLAIGRAQVALVAFAALYGYKASDLLEVSTDAAKLDCQRQWCLARGVEVSAVPY